MAKKNKAVVLYGLIYDSENLSENTFSTEKTAIEYAREILDDCDPPASATIVKLVPVKIVRLPESKTVVEDV